VVEDLLKSEETNTLFILAKVVFQIKY